MKKIKLLLAAFLLGPSAMLHAQAPAEEFVESNLSFNLKFCLQQPSFVQGGTTIQKYQTLSLKNADIIRIIGIKDDRSFSKKARLLFVVKVLETGTQQPSIVIRDGGADHLVTNYIVPAGNFFGPDDLAFQMRIAVSGAKTVTQLYTGRTTVILEGSVEDLGLGMDLLGLAKVKLREIISKKLVGPDEAPVLLPLVSLSSTSSGLGVNLDGNDGFVSGTVRVSGAKVVK